MKRSVNMDDVNFRVTVRPLPNLSLVTRYDFQYSNIDSQWRSNATTPGTYFWVLQKAHRTQTISFPRAQLGARFHGCMSRGIFLMC